MQALQITVNFRRSRDRSTFSETTLLLHLPTPTHLPLSSIMSTPNAHASSSKDHSKHKKHHAKDKDGHSHTHKHKSKSHGSKHSQPHEKKEKASPWEHRKCKMRLSIPPKYAEDWLSGIRDVLDGMLMRCVPSARDETRPDG